MGFVTKLILIFVCSAAIQAAEEFDTKALDEYIESKMRLPRIPGMALAIVKDNEIVYLKGYGQADPSGLETRECIFAPGRRAQLLPASTSCITASAVNDFGN